VFVLFMLVVGVAGWLPASMLIYATFVDHGHLALFGLP
jgi:hypothetical protein